MYTENHKTLLKVVEEDTNKWKDISCSSTGRFNIVKMCISPKTAYRFKPIPTKISISFLSGIEKHMLKLLWNFKGIQTAKMTLRKKANMHTSQFLISKLSTQLQEAAGTIYLKEIKAAEAYRLRFAQLAVSAFLCPTYSMHVFYLWKLIRVVFCC